MVQVNAATGDQDGDLVLVSHPSGTRRFESRVFSEGSSPVTRLGSIPGPDVGIGRGLEDTGHRVSPVPLRGGTSRTRARPSYEGPRDIGLRSTGVGPYCGR